MRRSPPSRPLLGAASRSPPRPWARLCLAAPSHQPPSGEEQRTSVSKAKKLMRLVNVEALKKKLETEREEVIGYAELLEACEGVGVARTREEAAAFARILDEAGVVLLFRDKVYLHPDKVPAKHGLSLIRGDASATCSASDVDQLKSLKSVQADLRAATPF